MHKRKKLLARRGIIGLAGFLLLQTPAFADTNSLQIDGNGNLSHSRNSATLTGTIACDAGESGTLTVHIYQSVGRLINIGTGNVASVTCNGNSGVWSATVNAIPGLQFQPGPATVVVRSVTSMTTVVTDPTTQQETTTTVVTSDSDFGGKVNLHP
jgi:hypothetical protein